MFAPIISSRRFRRCVAVLGWFMGQLFILLLWAKHAFWPYLIPLVGFMSFFATDALLHWSHATFHLEINLDPLLSTTET